MIDLLIFWACLGIIALNFLARTGRAFRRYLEARSMTDRDTRLSPNVAIFVILAAAAMALVIAISLFALIWGAFQP